MSLMDAADKAFTSYENKIAKLEADNAKLRAEVERLKAEIEKLHTPTYSEDGRYLVADSMARTKIWEIALKTEELRRELEADRDRLAAELAGVIKTNEMWVEKIKEMRAQKDKLHLRIAIVTGERDLALAELNAVLEYAGHCHGCDPERDDQMGRCTCGWTAMREKWRGKS